MSQPSSRNSDAAKPASAGRLRYLDPSKVRFFRHGAALRATIDGELSIPRAKVLDAFPLTDPGRVLSLRDGANEEIGLLADPEKLSEAGRRLVDEELQRRYILPVIRRILSVRERFGTQDWTVETDLGRRTFTTRHIRENLAQPTPDRVIITDVDENRYEVTDIFALDDLSQRMLQAHI